MSEANPQFAEQLRSNIAAGQVAGRTEESHVVRVQLPTTLAELENFCQTLRRNGAENGKTVHPAPVDGIRVAIYAELKERQ